MNEVTTKAYQRRSADQWLALIEEQASSGLSQRVFCEARGISLSSFYAAKQRLVSTSDEVDDTDFVPVDLGFDRASGWQVEVALGETVTLRFTRA
jgi:hypothetical protein